MRINETALQPENTLYVHRPLLRSKPLLDWAHSQGVTDTLPADDLHVTICYSRTPVDWTALTPIKRPLLVKGYPRTMQAFGEDKDVLVLCFDSRFLQGRWQEFQDEGCSWDYPNYQPHITLSYNSQGIDLSTIEPFREPLLFGPEQFAPID